MGRLVEVGLLSVGVEAQLGPPVAAVRVAVPSLPVPGLQDLGRHPGTQSPVKMHSYTTLRIHQARKHQGR